MFHERSRDAATRISQRGCDKFAPGSVSNPDGIAPLRGCRRERGSRSLESDAVCTVTGGACDPRGLRQKAESDVTARRSALVSQGLRLSRGAYEGNLCVEGVACTDGQPYLTLNLNPGTTYSVRAPWARRLGGSATDHLANIVVDAQGVATVDDRSSLEAVSDSEIRPRVEEVTVDPDGYYGTLAVVDVKAETSGAPWTLHLIRNRRDGMALAIARTRTSTLIGSRMLTSRTRASTFASKTRTEAARSPSGRRPDGTSRLSSHRRLGPGPSRPSRGL